jgi:hypothetical protein
LGNSARNARESSSGLAVACLITPSATAGRPLKRTATALGCGADLNAPEVGDAHRVTIAAGIGRLLDDDSANCAGVVRSVLRHYRKFAALAFDAAGRHLDVLLPQGVLDILRGSGCRLPGGRGRARCAWQICARRRRARRRHQAGLQARLDDAIGDIGDFQRRVRSEEKATQMIGLASASTLAITGSSIAVGSLLRTRETRSRTSDAAESGSRSSLKRTVIC